MIARFTVPLSLFLVLLAGGSTQRPGLTLAVQLGACLLLGWALAAPRTHDGGGEARVPTALLCATLALGILQLLPLPHALWSALPDREWIASGDAMIGQNRLWRPLSLDVAATFGSLLTLIVPTAFFFAPIRRPKPPQSLVLGSALAGTVANALLGILQSVDGSRRFYLFAQADWTSASGFFANPNHLGALLLTAVPLAVGLAIQERGAVTSRSRRMSFYVGLGALAASLLAVTPLNQSLAVAVLGGPVLLASAMIPSWGRHEIWRRRLSIVVLAGMASATALIYLARDYLLSIGQTGFTTRSVIWRPAIDAISANFPVGSGFGTFPRLFRHFEDNQSLAMDWINHAHNDYLEVLLEGGLPALLLLALFVLWWLNRAKALWFADDAPVVGRAAVVASGTLMLHSAVDFPLRTPALAALMGTLLAMMVVSIRPRPRREDGDLWTTRHWTVS